LLIGLKRIGSNDASEWKPYEWVLLIDKNLRRIGVNRDDIIRYDQYFEVPGRLYKELGAADDTHPLAGSIRKS